MVEDAHCELDLTMAGRNASEFTLAMSAGLAEPTIALNRDANCGSPTVAVPVFNGDELAGFILYEAHRDGTRLDPDKKQPRRRPRESAGQAYVRVKNSRLRALVESASEAVALS
jgi:hypothetical protein